MQEQGSVFAPTHCAHALPPVATWKSTHAAHCAAGSFVDVPVHVLAKIAVASAADGARVSNDAADALNMQKTLAIIDLWGDILVDGA